MYRPIGASTFAKLDGKPRLEFPSSPSIVGVRLLLSALIEMAVVEGELMTLRPSPAVVAILATFRTMVVEASGANEKDRSSPTGDAADAATAAWSRC